MIAWTKAVHIIALMVWCAGLVMLPTIYVHRNGLRGDQLHDLHRLARVVFINITSPAAFVAVIAGTALIFMRNTFTVWMALKLLAVGLLAAFHVREGYIILHLFDRDGRYARWRQIAATTATLCSIGAILWLVLAKPSIGTDELPRWILEPGGLQSLLETINPMP